MKRLTSFILHNIDITFTLHASLMCAILVILTFSPFDLYAAFSKHTRTSIVQAIAAKYETAGYSINNLSGNSEGPSLYTTYYSGPLDTKDPSQPNYITVQLKDGGISQTDEEDLVVYLRRTISYNNSTNINYAQPTAMGVQIWFTYTDGQLHTFNDYIFKVYFQYRGPSTEEYSSRIPIKDIWNHLPAYMNGIKISYLRFFTLETNNDHIYASRSNKLRETALNSFDVLKIGANDNYSGTFKDRFHLNTDYRTDLYNYNFRHTQGIFDDVNSVVGWEKISDTEKEQLKNDYGIEIPEFEFISNTSEKNKPICTLAEGQKLQPTHEVEHILYAMPGDVINLYPYYELYHTDQFYENFSHWYDYKTGGRLKYPDASTTNQWAKDYDMLDFLTEPEKIQISEKNGFFAGYGMAGYSEMHEYTVTNADQYIIAVNEINTHKEFSSITINAPAGLDFTGKSNVPMLGDGYAFQGIINGNGTTIKNLKYDKQGTEGVGVIGRGGGTVVVKNLILDSSCTFIGKKRVGGIVGYLESGNINISDIKTEAVIYGTANESDQNAAGILGAADGRCAGLKISNCYIGGTIGNSNAQSDYYNAAVCAGWWGASDNLSLKNIVVDCNLIAPDNNPGYRYYVRHNGHGAELITLDSGIKSRGGMTFENCYGNLQTTDECWIPLVYTTEVPASGKAKLQNVSWNINSMSPPMPDSGTGTGYSNRYSIATVDQYITAVNEINGDTNKSNSYIELTADLDFKNCKAEIPMIGTGSNNFGGRFNGRGHTIKNLFINKSGTENVGLFAWVKNGVVVENLKVDKSCVISGLNYVGLIGRLYNGRVTIQNVKTEATVTANTSNAWGMPSNGSFAGAILGCCADGNGNNCLNLKNVYIGGVIGKDGNINNSAIAPFFQTSASTSESVFENVVIICDVIGVNGTSGRQYISNVYTGTPTVTKQADGSFIKTMTNSNGSFQYKFINCYGNVDSDEKTFEFLTNSIKNKPIASWTDTQTPAMTGTINGGYNLKAGDNKAVDHKPGTVATFFCPKNPYDDNLCQSLPFQDGETEYIIAADFSKTFNLNKHLDIDNNTLSEPVIAFRHIFKIRDGKEFADQNFGSYAGNREYVRRNQKFVSARCGVPFQIRLATPVPKTEGPSVPTNIYYKKSDNEYGRVCGTMEIILLDGDTRKVIKPGDEAYTKFSFGDDFPGLGVRTIDGVNYSIGDGNNQYYRMLKCTPVGDVERHYIVQLVATENPADPSKRIKVCGATAEDQYLIVAEYNIRFLPKKGATMLTMDALYDNDDYAFARVETLEEKFMTPVDVIDFDEYININTLGTENQSLKNKLITLNETKDIYGNKIAPNNNSKYKLKNKELYHTFFKWPIPWNKANYAYGFDYRDGYNMYMLATHSDMVAYKQAVFLRDYFTYGPGKTDKTDTEALKNKDPNPVTGNKNADNHGRGLYDVKYYRSKRKIDEYNKSKEQQANELSTRAGDEVDPNAPELEQGYFYWGNAASDPGVATRLEINDLCPGSTIHVSAWLAEFSIDEEATNLSFNFVAVMKRDIADLKVKKGDRFVLHSFITGYVPDGGKFYRLQTGMSHWVYNVNKGQEYYDLNQITGYTGNKGKTTTTGVDDDMRGQWLNVYYSFVPRIAEFGLDNLTSEDVYYELELDNNAKSSKGADFGIDDIRIYLEPPMVDAQQVKPACKGENTRIRMISPFETLLEIAKTPETLSMTDNNADLAVYYTFISKSDFDKIVNESMDGGDSKDEARLEAFERSLVKFNYNRGGKDDINLYGKVNFNSKYLANPKYEQIIEIGENDSDDEIERKLGVGYHRTDEESGERSIIFECDVSTENLTIGNEYYVLLKAAPNEDGTDPDVSIPGSVEEVWEFFDMYGQCANKNEIYIKPSIIVRVDGIIAPNQKKIVVCENQIPVIQINVWGNDKTTGIEVPAKPNAPFDWFYGTTDDYKSVTEADMIEGGNKERTLSDALELFRIKYKDAESLKGIQPDSDDSSDPLEDDEIIQEKFEQWMIDIIEWASTPSEKYPNPRLLLHENSYPVPPYSLKNGETTKDIHVVAIPIACISALENYIVCPEPTQINVTVGNKAPRIKHGLTYLDYPKNMDDVPLRIGLDQLRTDKGSSASPEFEMKKIVIPIREAASSDGTVQSLKLVTKTKEIVENGVTSEKLVGCILLVRTDDPEYCELLDPDSQSNPEDDQSLQWIGDVLELTANTKEGVQDNMFTIQFDDTFKFKEGYSYSMRFDYADGEITQPLAESEEGESTQTEICPGHDLFTIKIVPKYLLWNGGVTDKTNLNWNNDNNWTRLEQDEIYSTKKEDEHRHYVTDGVNTNTHAFAPLDFTHVVVKKNVEAPYLYAPVFTATGPSTDREKYNWPAKPSEKDDLKVYSDYPTGEKGVGEATAYIQYDMAAFDYGTNKGHDNAVTGCRPWYANTCYEIHFKPGGTIMNQHELTYNMAWVDLELDPSRWYTLSLPLKEVFAGDFYLPTAGARQETELYRPISFDTEVNNRFMPAVFQRGWDKSKAKVYELQNPELSNYRNVAVRTFWSHVYNDVTEQYGSGTGFSVKTDVSALSESQWTDGNRVMFRFPKADETFYYYDKDYDQDETKKGHHTPITRTSAQYRLNDGQGTITAKAAENGHYFLVGNPFMTHMDIQEFLKTNNNLLEQEYWVVTEKGQITGVFDSSGAFVVADPTDTSSEEDQTDTSSAEDPTVIAPMQGFFVKTKDPAQSVTLKYDESMMRRYKRSTGHVDVRLTGTTRSEKSGMLRIVAATNGMPSSAALLGVNDGSNWNVEAIDNRDIDIPSIVYTVGNGMALSINSVKEAEGTEIGVIADEDTETVLRFEGVEAVEGLYLLDKADHSLTPLEEGMELTVDGTAAGRFFLTYGIADEGMLSGIEWSVSGGVLTAIDNATSGSLEVNVFDTTGRLLKHEATGDCEISVPLERGIYVVEICTTKERKSIKVRI